MQFCAATIIMRLGIGFWVIFFLFLIFYMIISPAVGKWFGFFCQKELFYHVYSALTIILNFIVFMFDQVRFLEITLDTFRMLQCLEWEPSGTFFQSSSTKSAQNGAAGPSRINYSQDITDPTLPPNPRKAILYRPSVTHILAVSVICSLNLYKSCLSVFYFLSPHSR